MYEVAIVSVVVTIATIASLWCLPIDLKIRVRTGSISRGRDGSDDKSAH